MIKTAIATTAIMLCSSFNYINADTAVDSKNDVVKKFDVYVNGALDVYSQFKTPTKQESEKFYNFLVKQWTTNVECSTNCRSVGYNIAKEYTNKENIKLVEPSSKK